MVFHRILGPLLFFIYINDIDDGIVNRLSKFADDTKLIGKITDSECVNVIRQDLQNLYK